MSLKIDADNNRFRNIVKGIVRRDLKKYIANGDMIGRVGGKTVRIPIPQFDVPRFRFGNKGQGGASQGDGEPGDILGRGEGEPGSGEAGDQPGEHIEITIEEFLAILAEELGLPRIKDKGKRGILVEKIKFSGQRRTGPKALRRTRAMLLEALKRSIASGIYNPNDPRIVPIKRDERFLSWKSIRTPQANAVIIYMMDVSGSMGDEQKAIVRLMSFWIDSWLRSQYKGIVSRYIIHDAAAKEVDGDTFFHTRESGGTVISSAYTLCREMIKKDYNPADWNIYPIHFSDGDNWSEDDNMICRLLVTQMLPWVNQWSYAQVHSPYGTGSFLDMYDHFAADSRVITTEIPGKEGIMQSIKDLFGRGN
ncbi:MAG: DUF444 family protein [Patescibacteria group bacterium]